MMVHGALLAGPNDLMRPDTVGDAPNYSAGPGLWRP
jgi:hypothetical protein